MQTINTAADAAANSSPPTMADGVVDLERIIETLAARTNGADAAYVRSVVTDVARQFDNARVQSFLPLLISKEAQHRLGSVGIIATA